MNNTTTKVYTFRTLNSTDLFLMFKIIGKIGIKEFSDCFDGEAVNKMLLAAKGKSTKDTASLVGMSIVFDIASVVTNNLPKCEAEIYQILSNTSNLSVEEIKELDMVTFAEMVIDFIKKEEFPDFFKAVSILFKPVK